jgi:hypothetical protein
MRKKISKSEKIRKFLVANPTATPKEIATKFKVNATMVYALRKKVSTPVAHAVSHPTTPNLQQVGGSHYKDMRVQPWEAMQAWMTPEQFAGFLRGNAIKYLARCDVKGGLQDIKKSQHYIAKLIEVSK